jgi:hypothetical protein
MKVLLLLTGCLFGIATGALADSPNIVIVLADDREPESVLETLDVQPHVEKSELFNLRRDPNQTHNVVISNRGKAEALKALLTKYQAQSRSVAR